MKASVYMVNVVFGHKEDAEEELLIRDDPAKTAQVLGLMHHGMANILGHGSKLAPLWGCSWQLE